MARGGREGAAPRDEKGGPQFPTQRHRRASSQELRYLEPYFNGCTLWSLQQLEALRRLARRDGDVAHRRRDGDVAHLRPLHRAGLILFGLVLADAAPRWPKAEELSGRFVVRDGGMASESIVCGSLECAAQPRAGHVHPRRPGQ